MLKKNFRFIEFSLIIYVDRLMYIEERKYK